MTSSSVESWKQDGQRHKIVRKLADSLCYTTGMIGGLCYSTGMIGSLCYTTGMIGGLCYTTGMTKVLSLVPKNISTI